MILNRLGVNKIKKIPWVLGAHAFLAILFLIFLDIVVGAILFYSYIVVVENGKEQAVKEDITFQYSTYQSIVNEWQARAQKFQESAGQKYVNPFTAESNISK